MSRPVQIITAIKPSTAIRHDYSSFSRFCHETGEPVVVTKNGEADLVVMSHEAFQKLMARHRLGQMLAEVDLEISKGTPMRDFEQTMEDIKRRIDHA